jgi:hypothetical protein
LTDLRNFENISAFEVHDYTVHSNHAPVSFALKTCTVTCCTDIPDRIFYRWNPDYKQLFLHDITQNVEQLCYDLNRCIDDRADTDKLVDIFTHFLTNNGNKYFETRRKNLTHAFFTNSNSNKEWFNEECKDKKRQYINAMSQFNLNKSAENKNNLYAKRFDYKYCCRAAKKKI